MKKTILLIGLLVLIVVLSGCTQSTGGGTGTQTPPATESFTGDISNLFPSRAEINSEYEKVYEVRDLNVESSYYPRYQSEGLAITGLQEAKEVGYDLLEGSYSPTFTVGEMTILSFDSSQNTKTFYNGLVEMIKAEGGYKEKTASGIDADCFGREYGSYAEGYGREYICQKKNIIFSVIVGGWEKSRFADADTWASSIAKKI